ncbi:Demethylmenaquinone methyltransferase [Aquisphaera giovannonii]|uniref:Demethylmenaquinone methyltransferase n=1 Tax=Aquisphaera giovannonii TaxID=406548 RepID=A0A5B9W7P5_9BACT|nr:methyltransferase domain-containing protein [Aquisphaera giovannonii]QEH36041.1 Demethylmenaquinone methyltransferase [Aquisphaera giovannonii]
MPPESSESSESNEPGLPAYAATMAAYHRAFEPELVEIVESLPIRRGQTVLDFACGDGAYAGWLARRVGASGRVIAMDLSPAYLGAARRNLAARPELAARVRLVRADAGRSPLRDGSVDLTWCAQSLYSLPDPVEAIRRMAAATRPGGLVAVFENDEMHHVLFPWPAEAELAFRRAELAGFSAESDRPWKFYVGRRLLRVFREAGLADVALRCFAFTRQAPLDAAAREFFAGFLENLRDRAGLFLEPDLRTLLEGMTTPGSGRFLLDDPDLCVTCVNHVAVGVRP